MDRTKTRGFAYYNHGRWLVDCPDCGSPLLINPEDKIAFCGVCFPEIMAIAFRRRVDKTGAELFDPVADETRRVAGRASAKPIHFIIPDNWKKIVEVLRPRHISFMSRLPGETIEDLSAENILHRIQNGGH